jgi:hypothetical protein
MPHWPLPALPVRDLTCDGRLSTYDENVLKLSKVTIRGKGASTGHPIKLPSPTKLARLSHFPPAIARRAALPCRGPVFYTISFLCLGCYSVHHCCSCWGGLARPARPACRACSCWGGLARRACWLRSTLRPGFQKLQLPRLSSTCRTGSALRPLPISGCLSALCQLPALFRLHALRRGL